MTRDSELAKILLPSYSGAELFHKSEAAVAGPSEFYLAPSETQLPQAGDIRPECSLHLSTSDLPLPQEQALP